MQLTRCHGLDVSAPWMANRHRAVSSFHAEATTIILRMPVRDTRARFFIYVHAPHRKIIVTMVPSEITAGELAQLLDISEQRVAALKAEGYIPTSPAGRILLPELMAALYNENADHRSRLASHELRQRYGQDAVRGASDGAAVFDAGLRMAALVGARLALAKVFGAPIGADAEGIARAAMEKACVEWFGIAPVDP